MATNGDQLEVKTGFGSIITHGTSVFIVLALAALTVMMFWEHENRSKEHDLIDCRLKLTLYLMQTSVENPIDWRRMPPDLYGCMPKFIYERNSTDER
jgi:hypothetical protein